jgi:multicomponent Na+:H+ antiporter subunit F
MIVGTVESGLVGTALSLATLCLIVAFLAAAYRILAGPTLADRVVGLDLVTMLLVVFLVLFKMISGVNAYIYAGIALALVSFLATVAFAHYIERTRGDSDE